MTFDSERLLDPTGWHILRELQENARISFTELGRRVGLSTPAVTERVRRLEDAGVITGYRATIDPARIGLPMIAIMRMTTLGGRCDRVSSLAMTRPEVLSCDRVTGSDSIVMRVAVASVAHLESLIDAFMPFGEITTSIVLSSVVEQRTLDALPEPHDTRDDLAPTPMRAVHR